ncbi:lipopolysaccharide heptosyltransferase II [Campylobacter lanienae]|uniref:lipopolysaccharide heptosyltransferase II n=1 Tax=Campylobacter lanienae TaxID=75658 RepID=UPI002A91D581|nr:lipopolysaccharide heptosyltransferase II [Campylobacter lanienae]MDY6135397.1 lipopolysaccharide heptosyltransferase II [Campylobacter lanienae]
MKIFIELPTWLGDGVMSSAAIANIRANFKDVDFTFFGSHASTALFEKSGNIIIDRSKKSKFRLLYLYKFAKSLPKFDAFISFRSHLASKALAFFIDAPKSAIYKTINPKDHLVIDYLNFSSKALNIDILTNKLELNFTPVKYSKPTLGINPGATYGSAKRWYPSYFAEVATKLSGKFDIVIFGGIGESEICHQISEILSTNSVPHQNLCGKTTISELASYIAGLDLFITNDSGPMHIAAAFKTPTIALFGPTNFTRTSPYNNPNARLAHLSLDCMPCMKRVCPLGTHECMKALKPDMVLNLINELN